MTRLRVTLPFAVVAIVLILAAFAWACTPDMHNMEVNGGGAGTQSSAPKTIIVTGNCTGGSTCPMSSNRELYMSPNSGNVVKVPFVTEHQSVCTTGSSDIGSVTNPVGIQGDFNGTGTIPGGTARGGYIICAGINTAALWDNYTIL